MLLAAFILTPPYLYADWAYETGDLRAVWGSAYNDIFAVGKRGIILHFDGTRWKPMDAQKGGCSFGVKLRAVWGSSGSDVYAVGCYDSQGDWFDHCSENSGMILHYNGSVWQAVYTEPFDNLSGLWGSSADDVFAVGDGGMIMHYDGMAWSSMASPTTESLYAVWGASGSDVFAVGFNGTILHYDGAEWSSMSSGTAESLNGVWGISGTHVYAVGSGGTVLQYNGNDWLPPPAPGSGTTENLTNIWGSAPWNIFAVGDEGTVLRNDGSIWSVMTSDTLADLNGIWGSSGGNIFAVGDGSNIIHYNGSLWSLKNEASTEDLYDVWGTSENNVIAVGDSGTIIRYSGSGWKSMDSGTTEMLRGVWGSSVSNVFAVGGGGIILQYDGGGWSTIHSDPEVDFTDIWGSSGSDIYIVGWITLSELPKGRILHFDGSNWTTRDFNDYMRVLGVWGSDSNNVYASTYYLYDSDPGFGGEIVLMGVMLHNDGSSWSATEIGDKHRLNAMWGSAADNIYGVGYLDIGLPYRIESLDILRFNGSAWHTSPWDVPSDEGQILTELHSVWGKSSDDVYAVGSVGSGGYSGHAILRNRGGVWWMERFSRASHTLQGVWGAENGTVFSVGGGGVILRLSPQSDMPSPADTWAKIYGSEGKERAIDIAPTTDGGSIVAGQTDTLGASESDIWLLKLDREGNSEWQHTIGGTGLDSASAVIQTADGGYIVAGTTFSFGSGESDSWVLKLDPLGRIEWEKAYGGVDEDSATEVLETAGCSGGYVVLGTTKTDSEDWDSWLLKLDKAGGVEWQKIYPMTGRENLVSLARAKGYGYFISGKTHPFGAGYGDYLVLRLDDEGDVLWGKTFGLRSFIPPDHWNINIESEAMLCATEDGGAALIGSSSTAGVNTFAWMVKIDAKGGEEWQRIYAGAGDKSISSVDPTQDLGYIVGGGVERDGWLLKLDKEGNVEWQKILGGLGSNDRDEIVAVRQTTGGGYIAAGWMTSFYTGQEDFWVLSFDESGLIPDCAGVSTWYGGSEETAEPGTSISAAAVETGTTETPTNAAVIDTEVTDENACLSTLGDLIDLPQTGQKICYNTSGAIVSCACTGQDGDVRAGATWPSPRFVDNEDGTLLDRLTGLMWLKDANYAQTIGHDPDGFGNGIMKWKSALDLAAAMNSGDIPNLGYTDWRMANLNELESLVNSDVTNIVAWLGEQGFENVQNNYAGTYWSSTTDRTAGSAGHAWVIQFLYGRHYNRNKGHGYYTFLVRDGQWFHPNPAYPANVWKTGQNIAYHPGDDGDIQAGVAWPVPRFTDHGDGTVTDNLTGLMWLKDANCFGGRPWEEALSIVEDFNTANRGSYGCLEYAAEYADWYLPNRNEFISLFDRSKAMIAGNPALPSGHPFQNWEGGYGGYWSSTSVLTGFIPDKAWQLEIYGWMNFEPKIYGWRLWPVRGGVKLNGDLDKDGDVDGLDLILLLEDWERTDCCEGEAALCKGDLDDDCDVDDMDLERFSWDFGRATCLNLDTTSEP